MKIILLISVLLALAAATTSVNQTYTNTVLASNTTTNWTMTLSTNTLTDGVGTYDLTLKLTLSATVSGTADDEYYVICLDHGTSGFSLSADKTSMTAFAVTAVAGATATFVGTNGAMTIAVGTAANYTHSSTSYNHGVMADVGTPASTDTLTTTGGQMVWTAVTEAQRTTLGLPKSYESGMFVCWSQGPVATGSKLDFTSATAIGSAWVNKNNVTIGAYGAAVVAGFAATLAYAF